MPGSVLALAAVSFDEPRPGTLVIAGGGKLPREVGAKFVELAGGGLARIVVVPTASEFAADPGKQESFLQPWRELGAASVDRLHTRDRKQANDPKFVKPLREATGVWLGGGDQNRLISAYRGTLVEQELRRLLERGGVIGGTSAGAAVMSEVMIQGGREATVRTGPGFGFLKGVVVDQHFTQRKRIGRLRVVLSRHLDEAGLGIDEGTAVVVRGDSMTVLGAGTATLFWPRRSHQPNHERALKAGESFDRRELRPAVPAKRAG